MLLKDAKILRDKIKSEADLHCIVPLGAEYRPDKYIARIFGPANKEIDFENPGEWAAYDKKRHAKREAADRGVLDWYNRRDSRLPVPRDTRSPIERLIDESVGR